MEGLPGHLTVDVEPQHSLTMKLKLVHTPSEVGIRNAMFAFIRALGLDLKSQHFSESPARLTKLWMEWMRDREITVKAFQSSADDMVTMVAHRVVTLCPHHFLPVEMICDLSYIPSGWVVGLSKLPRILDLVGGSFVLQEEFTHTVVKIVEALLMPRGIACRVRARHGCMRLRGVRTPGWVVTSSLKGVMLTDEKARVEFQTACRDRNDFDS
jgi:GTP cyclohydrolase I